MKNILLLCKHYITIVLIIHMNGYTHIGGPYATLVIQVDELMLMSETDRKFSNCNISQ